MKFIALVFSLSILASCTSEKTENPGNSSTSYIEAEETYDLPKPGFFKSINLNYRFEQTYEYMTVSPGVRNPVPGDRPFILHMNDVDRMTLNYYSNQDIKSVSYVNYKDMQELNTLKNTTTSILKNPQLKKVSDFYRSFEYGTFDPNFLEQDLAGKVFVVESEAADLPYVSKMTVMFWLECEGGLKWKSKEEYSCPTKLKFNYKLLDYKLDKIID